MSTLETAIVFTIVLTLITFFVTAPESTAISYDASPERLCTYLTGLSDNFRLIYGKAAGIASGVDTDESKE